MLTDNNVAATVRDAMDGVVVAGVVTVTELTEACWRSKRGLVGLRARVTTRRRRRRDRRRERKQQPFRDGKDDGIFYCYRLNYPRMMRMHSRDCDSDGSDCGVSVMWCHGGRSSL
ncbi:hypothetical protein Droror1_Dr00024066 [Drosera rotundifolia]